MTWFWQITCIPSDLCNFWAMSLKGSYSPSTPSPLPLPRTGLSYGEPAQTKQNWEWWNNKRQVSHISGPHHGRGLPSILGVYMRVKWTIYLSINHCYISLVSTLNNIITSVNVQIWNFGSLKQDEMKRGKVMIYLKKLLIFLKLHICAISFITILQQDVFYTCGYKWHNGCWSPDLQK